MRHRRIGAFAVLVMQLDFQRIPRLHRVYRAWRGESRLAYLRSRSRATTATTHESGYIIHVHERVPLRASGIFSVRSTISVAVFSSAAYFFLDCECLGKIQQRDSRMCEKPRSFSFSAILPILDHGKLGEFYRDSRSIDYVLFSTIR